MKAIFGLFAAPIDDASVLFFRNTAPACLKSEPFSSQDFSRILLVRPSALGNVVHAIPLLLKLRVRFPVRRSTG